MKNTFLTVFALLNLCITSYPQVPEWAWAKGSSMGAHREGGNSITVDNIGNVYIAGEFNSAMFTLDAITLIKSTADLTDMFIAKYNNNGDVIWAKNFGGSIGETSASSIAVDDTGNLYVAGSFASDTLTIDNIKLPNTNYGQYDLFFAKFDTDGNVIWAKSAGGISSEYVNGIATDEKGYLYVTGSYRSDFTLGNTQLINNGSRDFFISKCDGDGNIIWVQTANGTIWDEGYGVSIDAAGNVFAVGIFTSPDLQFGSTALTNAGSSDMSIIKYDNNGNVLWAKSTGGNDYETANSVITDATGNVYVTGSFNSSFVSFDGMILNSVASDDLFVVKYDTGGTPLWAKSIGGNSMDRGTCINIDSTGIYT